MPDRMLRGALDREAVHAARINEIFDDVDLLVTPVLGTLPVEVTRKTSPSRCQSTQLDNR